MQNIPLLCLRADAWASLPAQAGLLDPGHRAPRRERRVPGSTVGHQTAKQSPQKRVAISPERFPGQSGEKTVHSLLISMSQSTE